MTKESAEKQASKYNKIPGLSAVVVRILGYGNPKNDWDVEVKDFGLADRKFYTR